MYTFRIIISIMLMFAARPVFNNTVWQNERSELVLDAGTMTVITSLEFLPGSKVIQRISSYMPPHPASYMNADGTIDTNPGWTSEWEKQGKYKYRRGKMTITFDDDPTMELSYKNNTLIGKYELTGEEMIFIPKLP